MNNQIQRDFSDRYAKRQFRHAYVFNTRLDYRPLAPYCDKIIQAVEGYGDHVDNIQEQLEKSLADFDDNKDVICPGGGAYVNMLAGTIIYRKLAEKYPANRISFTMAIWYDYAYRFWMVYPDNEMESYQIVQ